MKVNYKYTSIDAEYKYDGIIDDAVKYITKEQSLKSSLWESFVKPFINKEDSIDGGWRGEFFGKTMRGACLIYSYTKSQELYDTLFDAAKKILATQEENGRISSYRKEDEFTNWDVWSRKYVITGLWHFYKICKNEKFKTEIVGSIKRQLSYIMDRVGDEDGKIPITKTSVCWDGLNSATLLEPVVETFKITNDKKYLRFSEHIISTGGSNLFNFIDAVKNGELLPYQYPINKAYEMISFFEGVLAYYEVTGKKEFFDIVVKFWKLVKKSEITIIGCAGCNGELFNNSVKKQTEEQAFSQETCVAVTWIRVCYRIFMLTGEAKYIEEVENSAYNTLYGTLNYANNLQYSTVEEKTVPGLPIDSYTPLVASKRGVAIAGYRSFNDGGYYGCCAAIASAGLAIMPLSCVMQSSDEIVFNHYENGKIRKLKISGAEYGITVSGVGAECINAKIEFTADKAVAFKVKLIKPRWAENFSVIVGGKKIKAIDGYLTIEKVWESGDCIYINAESKLNQIYSEKKVAFTFGKYVLGVDSDKQRKGFDIRNTDLYNLSKKEFKVDILKPINREQIRIKCSFADKSEIILTDYASCGVESYDTIVGVWNK